MSVVTVDRMKKVISNGPSGRNEFRSHLRNCSICRLTQYSGLGRTQTHEYSEDTDCGALCEKGFDLFVPPDLMRPGINQKRVGTETVMRIMGFPADWSGL